MKTIVKAFCPIYDMSCPYFKEDGSCYLVDLKETPMTECDDFYYSALGNEDEYIIYLED